MGNDTITIEDLTQKALRKLNLALDDPEPIPIKDLKDVVFGLLDRKNGGLEGSGSTDRFLTSEAARGAVLGALQGLASITGRSFNRKDVEARVLAPKALPQPTKEEREYNPYEGLATVSKQESTKNGEAILRARMGKIKRKGKK